MSRRRRPLALLGLAIAALLLIMAPAAGAGSRDRNHDGIPDWWEVKHHLSLKVNQAHRDQDHDRMDNLAEFKAGTDPREADSDHDGVRDDREHAGTVVSFSPASGRLVLRLFRNEKTVEGTVDARTEIECEDHAAPSVSAGIRRGGGDDDIPTPAAASSSDDVPGAHADDPGEDDHEAGCAAALTPGAVVHEADFMSTPAGLHFDKIELGAPAPTTTA